jgi:RNA polymerase sigma-70 factor (ECF subfamily)
MPETAADNELLDRYRRGDTAALEELLSRWGTQVRRLLVRLAGPRCNKADVEDLGQEVFLRVVRAASAYRPQWAFSTLLYRIVLNVTRDAARRGQRRIRTTNESSVEPAAGGTTPGEDAERDEAARLVAAALASLPDELREPLILRHYGDLTFQQAAEVLGVPTSTVKSRVQVALVRLRGELRKCGLDDREPT